MRPNNFTLNSDYFALATGAKTQLVISFSNGTVAGSSQTKQTQDLTVPNSDKAFAEYLISEDGNTWRYGNDIQFDYNSNLVGCMYVNRVSANVLRATLMIANKSSSSVSYPAKQFWVREHLIVAPDIE